MSPNQVINLKLVLISAFLLSILGFLPRLIDNLIVVHSTTHQIENERFDLGVLTKLNFDLQKIIDDSTSNYLIINGSIIEKSPQLDSVESEIRKIKKQLDLKLESNQFYKKELADLNEWLAQHQKLIAGFVPSISQSKMDSVLNKIHVDIENLNELNQTEQQLKNEKTIHRENI